MSWVFGPGGTTTTPGGADKDIQFNNNGSFSGSALLTTDGSGSLSASVNITASAFYGDGSNLTGITASAVQVADGPEYSIQFRRDAPVTGEISGSINLRTNAARDAMFLTGGLYVQGNATIGNGTGGGHIIVNGDPDTKISFGPTAGGDSMDFIVGNHRLIRLDENGTDQVILGSAASDVVHVSGSLTSSLLLVSSSQGSIDYLKDWGGGPMATTESLGGKITLGGYGNPYLQTRNINVPDIGGGYNNFDIGHSGQIHLSSSMGGGAFEFEGIKFTNNPGDGIVGFESNRISFYHNTGSLTGDALEYVWAINSDHAGSGEESAWVKLDLSSSTKNFQVGGRDNVQLQAAAGLLVEGGTGQFNNGVTVGGATSNFNATVNINNTSSFGGPASFNNHAASFNQGITVGGAASNFNSNLNANSNVTLGAADGTTPITINASNIDMSTNNSVITLRDGQNGLTDNGALMFFTGSGGDFMKFHTSGSAKGVVFPQEVYLSNIPANRVLVSDTNGKVTSHSPFTFTSDVLAVPTVTASVGIDVTSSANGSINIGEGIRYIFGGDDRLDVFENEFRIRKTNLYQAVFPEQTSNFDIGDSQVFLVDTNGSVVTGTLPGVTSTDDYGITYTIKDSGGNAETNNVVIEPSGSQKIDGGSAAKIETNYGAITVMGISSSVNGFGWAIVSAT